MTDGKKMVEYKTRLSQEEAKKLDEKIAKSGMSKYEFVRKSLLGVRTPRSVKMPVDLQELTKGITDLSNRINELTTKEFPNDYIYYSDFENIVIEQRRLNRMATDILERMSALEIK